MVDESFCGDNAEIRYKMMLFMRAVPITKKLFCNWSIYMCKNEDFKDVAYFIDIKVGLHGDCLDVVTKSSRYLKKLSALPCVK